MVVARRPPRERRSRRWLWLAALLTLSVLGVDALVSAGTGDSRRELGYLDLVRAESDRSTRQGADLAEVRERAVALGRPLVLRRVRALERDARASLRRVENLEPPRSMRTAHGLLVATAAARARAAARFAAALREGATGNPTSPMAPLVEAGQDLAVADRAYELFLESLPEDRRKTMPPSRWVRDDQGWSEPEVAAFLAGIRAQSALAPVHDVAVITVVTNPAAMGKDGDAAVIPPTRVVRLQVVVANIGNEAERRVTVEAAVVPDSGGAADTARDFVDLAPGQRATVSLGLRPAPGRSVMTVRAGPVEQETSLADNERRTPVRVG